MYYSSGDIKKVVCPYCKGDKTIDMGWENYGHSRGSFRITETCPVCKGEGITIRQTIYKSISQCDQEPIKDISNKKELNEQSEQILKIAQELQQLIEKLKEIVQK